MKKIFMVAFTLLILVSCDKQDTLFGEISDVCEYKTEIKSPIGYGIRTIGEIEFNGTVDYFQFVNETTAYAMLVNNVGGFVELFNTQNGGETWEDLEIGINYHPVGMSFRNEKVGVISVHDVTGCPPPNCQNKCVILRTMDGGKTWVNKELEDLKGVLYHPKYDDEGNLFALLTLDKNSTLMKSTDDGETWEIFFSSSEIGFDLVTYSYEIYEDKFYISGKRGKILVVNSYGQLIKTIEVEDSSMWDVEIIDENRLIVVLTGKVLKSMNGGDTWEIIYDRSARMIGFDSAEKGLMILNKSYCPSDVYQANDHIASTVSGGKDWIEAEETTTNLYSDFRNSQRLDNGIWYIFVRNRFIEIDEK